MPKNLSKETKNKEYFLVCVDESNEFQSALEYACTNAQKQKINLILLYIIEMKILGIGRSRDYNARGAKSKAKELLNIHLAEIKKLQTKN